MKVGVIAASVAALATMGFASSALAASAQSEHVTVGPAGYSQGPNTVVIAGGVPVPTVGPGDHVVICHALGEANKDTYVQIAPSAGVVFGHAGDGHQLGEDIIPPFIYQPNGNGDADRSLAEGQNWDAAHIAIYQNGCAALPPVVVVTDLCLNIEGNQESVPAGMIRDAHGNCAAPPVVVVTDLCLNIEGNQESVPAGMIRDAHGNCAAPPVVVVTDLCLNIEGNQETVPAGMNQNGEGACLMSNLVNTSTVVTASAPTLEAVVTPAAVVVAPVAAKPVGAVLGVSTKVVTKAKAKAKAKAKKAKAKKAKVVKAKVAKPKVTRIRVLPFTP